MFIPGGRAALGTPSPGGMWVPVILDGMNCWGTHQRSGMFVLVFLIMLLWLLCFTMYYIYGYTILCIVLCMIYSNTISLKSVVHDFLWDFRSSFGILSDQAAVDPISCSSGWLPAVNVQPGSQLWRQQISCDHRCFSAWSMISAVQGPKKWTRTEVWGLGVLGVSVNAELSCWISKPAQLLNCLLERFKLPAMYLTRNVLISKKLMKYDEISEDLTRFGSMKWSPVSSSFQFFSGIFWVNKRTRRWGSLQSLSWFDGWRREAGHLMVIWWDFCWWFLLVIQWNWFCFVS